MYGIDKDTQESVSSQLGVGIHENCHLEEVRFEPASKDPKKSQQKVLRFVMADSKGLKHTETIFEINPENMKTWKLKEGQTLQDLVNQQYKVMNAMIKHISNRVLPEDASTGKVANWEQFGAALLKMFARANKQAKFRLKLRYDKKNNVVFGTMPFMESMDVPKAESNIVIDAEYDPQVKKEAKKTSDEDEFAQAKSAAQAKVAAGAGTSDDIPF